VEGTQRKGLFPENYVELINTVNQKKERKYYFKKKNSYHTIFKRLLLFAITDIAFSTE